MKQNHKNPLASASPLAPSIAIASLGALVAIAIASPVLATLLGLLLGLFLLALLLALADRCGPAV